MPTRSNGKGREMFEFDPLPKGSVLAEGRENFAPHHALLLILSMNKRGERWFIFHPNFILKWTHEIKKTLWFGIQIMMPLTIYYGYSNHVLPMTEIAQFSVIFFMNQTWSRGSEDGVIELWGTLTVDYYEWRGGGRKSWLVEFKVL